ncbi:MAG: aldehyde dehydrogenase family protein, partial [Oscillospiraceae bacterium]
MKTLVESAKAAKAASLEVAQLGTERKNEALRAMAKALVEKTPEILAANEKDMTKGRESGMPESLLDRLMLNADRIAGMAEGLDQVAALPDPIGRVMDEWTRPNGLVIRKVRVPMGVIGIIYEARPNVTVDAAALAFKAGSAMLLRGSSSAYESNAALVRVMRESLEASGVTPDAVCLVRTRATRPSTACSSCGSTSTSSSPAAARGS